MLRKIKNSIKNETQIKYWTFYGKIENPIRQILEILCNEPPPKFVKGANFKNLNDEQLEQLQNWCSYFARPYWNTGIGIMDAAELMVEEAIANGNIEN